MNASPRRLASLVLTGILGATLLACGSTPPAAPGGSSAPGGSAAPLDSGGPGTSGASDGAQAAASATGFGFDEIGANELALADHVAQAAGLPDGLGAEPWSWARQFLLDEAAKASQNLVITGEAGLMASLEGGPPRLDVAIAEGGNAGVVGLAMAGAMISSALQGSSGSSGINTGSTPRTETHTANGETTTGSITFNLATTVAGSSVEGDVTIGVDVTVTDAATGALKRQGHFKSQGKIKLDFCPDANGKVRGHSSMTIEAGMAGSVAAAVVVEADIVGTVGEDAYLNDVEFTGQSTQNTTTAGSSTPRTVRTTISGRYGIDRSGQATYIENSASGQGEGPGDLTQAEVDAGYRQTVTAAAMAIWAMGDAAQKKWRGGACVEIRSSEQSREVRKNELVQFESKVWHKFDNVELNKNIVNEFTGKQSLDPVGIPVPAPVTNSFKAGPMKDDTGTIVMTTTSNRGIGTLTLTFRVEGGWYIEEPNFGGILVGLKCGDPDGEWIVNGTYSVAGFVGDQQWIITINPDLATGKFQYTTSQEGQRAGVKIYLVGSSKGTVTMRLDPVDGMAHMVLQETKHTFVATTQYGGEGHNTDTDLFRYTFDWDVGGDC